MTNGSTEIERNQSTGSLRCLNRTGARMRSRRISKLDFPPLGGIAEQVAQVIRKGGVDFCHLGVSRGGSKSHLGPQMTPHQGERITEGRGAFVIPRGVADGEGWRGERAQSGSLGRCSPSPSLMTPSRSTTPPMNQMRDTCRR
jgi:hypothetical protein